MSPYRELAMMEEPDPFPDQRKAQFSEWAARVRQKEALGEDCAPVWDLLAQAWWDGGLL